MVNRISYLKGKPVNANYVPVRHHSGILPHAYAYHLMLYEETQLQLNTLTLNRLSKLKQNRYIK